MFVHAADYQQQFDLVEFDEQLRGAAGGAAAAGAPCARQREEDAIWRDLQSTYKIQSKPAADDEFGYDRVESLYDSADLITRRDQQVLVVDPFEDDRQQIDLSSDETFAGGRDAPARPVANGWA